MPVFDGKFQRKRRVWLQASSLNLNDNDPVLTWSDDAPGATHNLTQSNPSRRPLFKSGGINGHPSVCFDGDDSLVRNPSLNFGPTSLTAIIVYDPINYSGILHGARLISNGHGGWTEGYFMAVDSVMTFLGGVGSNPPGAKILNTLVHDADSSVNTSFGSGPKISAMIWDAQKNILALWSQGKKLVVAKELGTGGTLSSDQRELSTAGLTTLNTNNHYNSGFSVGGGTVGWDMLIGHISEILVYNRALTDAQMRRYTQHLSAKYGISLVP